jgi:hypothetical protein
MSSCETPQIIFFDFFDFFQHLNYTLNKKLIFLYKNYISTHNGFGLSCVSMAILGVARAVPGRIDCRDAQAQPGRYQG